jgi:multiple sugar transport system permease protein
MDKRDFTIWMILALACGLAYVLYPHPKKQLDSKGITEIVLWTPIDPMIADPLRPVLEEFERRHPQYRIRHGSATVRSDTGDPTRFLLGVAGGMPPDLIMFDRFAIIEWASRGAFTDLTPYIQRDQNLPDGIRRENYLDVAWSESVYKGANYAIACEIDTRAMFYSDSSLLRAGFAYKANEPQVLAGKAKAGAARPPQTWEEMCLKRLHARGRANSAGVIVLKNFERRPEVNADQPATARPDLTVAGVREGDVVALIKGTDVFRGRIRKLTGADQFQIDFNRDQPAGMTALPQTFTGECEIKIFDQDSYVCRLTRFESATGKPSALGFLPMFGNSWLYMFGWLNGAEFMNPDGTQCRLDSPEIVQALQWVTDVYDAQGGYQTSNVFLAGASSAGLDPFLSGRIAMRIDIGDYLPFSIMLYKPDFNFGAAPPPIPEKRLRAGMKSMGWVGGYAYAIPMTAKQKEPAWELLRWINSMEGSKLLWEARATLAHSQGRRYFPRMHPDKRILDWIRGRYIDGNPTLSANVVQAYHQFQELLPDSRYRPVTPVGQNLWNEQIRASDAAMLHEKPPYDALNYGSRRVQEALDRILHPPPGAVVNWRVLIGLYLAGVVLCFVGLILRQKLREGRSRLNRTKWMDGYLAASPWLAGFIIFGAGPILFSFVISFCHYDVLNSARWVGFENYTQLIGSHFDSVVGDRVWNDPIFWKSLGNTAYMALSVPMGIALGLLIAILLDSKVRGLHFYRTLFYLPAIVPAVATFILWIWVLDPSRGLINRFLEMIGISHPPYWLQDPLWSKPSLILMGLWGVGGSMVIWLAGLKEIPESMYEAASIDGANRFQRFMKITLPLLSPYIFFNFVMGLIGVFQTFESAYIMTDGGPADSTLFYGYKLFNEAFRFLNMGAASAMAWLLFFLILLITLGQLWLGKRWVHYGN